jgi:hypothetical protein
MQYGSTLRFDFQNDSPDVENTGCTPPDRPHWAKNAIVPYAHGMNEIIGAALIFLGLLLASAGLLLLVGRGLAVPVRRRTVRQLLQPLLLLTVGLVVGAVPFAFEHAYLAIVGLGERERVIGGERALNLTGWDPRGARAGRRARGKAGCRRDDREARGRERNTVSPPQGAARHIYVRRENGQAAFLYTGSRAFARQP